jgi:hypothetical protein
MTYHPKIDWSEEMDRAIKTGFELYDKPHLGKLADTIGVSRSSVTERIEVLGLKRAGSEWSEEHINLLIEKWDTGLTGTEIGILIGKSRNAIIGKAYRLKLKRRAPSGNRLPRRDPNIPKPPRKRWRPKFEEVTEMVLTPKKAVPPRFYPAATPIARGQPISIMALNSSTCHAIVGRGADGLAVYCGDFTFLDKPYCEGHYAMYYQPPNARSHRR